MTPVRISCVDKDIKDDLVEAISPDTDKKTVKKIKSLPECEDGKPIGTEKRAKREPSEYNMHVSECMKDGNTMKECAVEWSKKKKRKEN